MNSKRVTSSFRDSSGFIFKENGIIKRVINSVYFSQFNLLTNSGFYSNLIKKKLLIPHQEITRNQNQIVIQPEQIPFISYPYEWSFLQYKQAALLTLKIQKLCLENNFTLKDATAFNICFHEGKPIFIDTLSFEIYHENSPWHAYKQFIMHFLGPLVLSKYYGFEYLKILSYDIDGISIEKLSKLLPLKTILNPTLLTNVHLLSKFEKSFPLIKKSGKNNLSKKQQLKLIDSLYDFILNLKVKQNTEWDNYYNQTNYKNDAIEVKKQLVKNWFTSINGKNCIDIGGNDGTFSRELIKENNLLLVVDVDANAVEQNYKLTLKNKEKNILPLVVDILNPPSNYGFNNQERFSFLSRVQELKLDGCLGLAVIHHISITGNIPFDLSVQFFAKLAPNLLIEFPTRNDSWVKYLLESKRAFASLFDFYNEDNFEKEYANYFDIVQKQIIPNTERILYSLKRKSNL